MIDPGKANPTVIGLGEVLWDCFRSDRRPGGAPANVAYHASQFGCCGVVASRVGDDDLGEELVARLHVRGVDASLIQIDSGRPTGTVTVDDSVPDDPQYTIHADVAWDHLEYSATWAKEFGTCDAVCFGTLAQRSPYSRQTISQCLNRASEGGHSLIVYDVNLRQQYFDRAIIEQSLTAATMVKLNTSEVDVLSALLTIHTVDLESFGRAVCDRFEIESVCITKGDQGCSVIDRSDDLIEVTGQRVEVVDAVGAGDAFTAAIIFAMLSGWPIRAVAEFANEIGALVASREGAMPDVREEVELIRSRYA